MHIVAAPQYDNNSRIMSGAESLTGSRLRSYTMSLPLSTVVLLCCGKVFLRFVKLQDEVKQFTEMKENLSKNLMIESGCVI